MRQFLPVHPAIIDLYLHILHLNDMGEMLDGYVKQNLDVPDALQSELQDSASLFAKAERQVLETLGTKSVVDQQLTWFHERRGRA
jgi:hypothetical protein